MSETRNPGGGDSRAGSGCPPHLPGTVAGSKAKALNIYVLLIECVFYGEISPITVSKEFLKVRPFKTPPSPLVISLVSMGTRLSWKRGVGQRLLCWRVQATRPETLVLI